MAELERFYSLRKRLFEAIGKALKEDCGKSYEGAFFIGQAFPNYYDDEEAKEQPFMWYIHLDCYIVGPHRHYDWDGKTLDEVIDKCEKDIFSWLEDPEDIDFPCDAPSLVQTICIGKENKR